MWLNLFFALLSLTAAGSVNGEAAQDSSFDYFIFSQIWPITSCDIWEDKNPSKNTCFLPIESKFNSDIVNSETYFCMKDWNPQSRDIGIGIDGQPIILSNRV